MAKEKYIVLYILKGMFKFYVGCGDERTRYSHHRWKLLNYRHTKKMMKAFEQDGQMEYYQLVRLPYTYLNASLLKKMEKVLITELHKSAPQDIINTQNHHYHKDLLSEWELNFYHSMVIKLLNLIGGYLRR